MDAGRTAVYTYDSLYRLSTAVTTGSTNYAKWGLSWVYDRYGNRTNQNQTAGSPPTNSIVVSATTNRLTGAPYAYDLNGNMTNDGYNTLVYDAENRTLSATNGSTSGSYTYDGNNLRVKKISASTTTVYVFSGSKVIAEYVNGAVPTAPTREYIYSGGALLARIEAGATKYYHQDQLSNRLVTDSSGNVSAQIGHYPFGESWYNSTGDKLLFTSYERDPESGNDYAMARYDISRLGRFSSVDPLSGTVSNPQSFNKYAYTQNNPTNFTDPSGLFLYVPPDHLGPILYSWFFNSGGPRIPWHYSIEDWDDTHPRIDGGNSSGKISDVVNAALKLKKLSQCLNQIFGPGNILNNQNLPHVDTTQTSIQLTNYINGLNPNTPVANPNFTTASTFATPVPANGKGTVLLASDYFYNSSTSMTFLQASYIHETGNILAIQRNRFATASNLAAMFGDTDTGAALEECIFGGSVQPSGTVHH